jgi:dolichol-phosphate mannosyltransferase
MRRRGIGLCFREKKGGAVKISVILPTYNESGNIVRLITSILENIPKGYYGEIIQVDDNSPDQTHQKVKDAFKNDPRVVPIIRTSDKGLAKSIHYGINNSSGDLIIVMDTDFSHHPKVIPTMIHIAKIFDVVVGSRFCEGGDMDNKRHYLASLAFNWWIRLILRTQIQDNLSGFFLIRRERLMKLPLDTIFQGYGEYFFKLLHYAQKAGCTIIEVPVIYQKRPWGESKSNFLKMVFSYSKALFKIKFSAIKQ